MNTGGVPLDIYFRERLEETNENVDKISIQMQHNFDRVDRRLERLEKHWIVMSTLGGVAMFIGGSILTLAMRIFIK